MNLEHIDFDSNKEYATVKRIVIDETQWVTYLEQKILKKYIQFYTTNGRDPEYVIVSPKDRFELMKLECFNIVRPTITHGYDGFMKYKGMSVLTTLDLTTGEILVL